MVVVLVVAVIVVSLVQSIVTLLHKPFCQWQQLQLHLHKYPITPVKFHSQTDEPWCNNNNKLMTMATMIMATFSFIDVYLRPMPWLVDNVDSSCNSKHGIPSPGVEEEENADDGEDILGKAMIVLVKAASPDRIPRPVAPLESPDACTLGD
jgi:hypothetical protein